ncbi:MAG TPA: hypothetical protein VIJ66_04260 [Solirubrobacteraceae bacterium]
MSLWMLFVLLALIKLPLIGLMLWMPFRNDVALLPSEATDSTEEDGGSHTLPAGPIDPHPRMPLPRSPRRDPHGSPALPAPARVRTPVRAKGVEIHR